MGSNNPNHLKVGDNSHSKMLSTVKTMVGYFGLTHPCPYCHYHFLCRVSRSDADWQDLGQSITVTGIVNGERQLVSESELYPLEYLFLGRSMGEKISTIVDGLSLMLFFWKFHNAVTASFKGSLRCKTQEETDDPNFSGTAEFHNAVTASFKGSLRCKTQEETDDPNFSGTAVVNNDDDDDNHDLTNSIEYDGTPATTRM